MYKRHHRKIDRRNQLGCAAHWVLRIGTRSYICCEGTERHCSLRRTGPRQATGRRSPLHAHWRRSKTCLPRGLLIAPARSSEQQQLLSGRHRARNRAGRSAGTHGPSSSEGESHAGLSAGPRAADAMNSMRIRPLIEAFASAVACSRRAPEIPSIPASPRTCCAQALECDNRAAAHQRAPAACTYVGSTGRIPDQTFTPPTS